MNLLSSLYWGLDRLLAPCGYRLLRVTPDRLRGIDLLLDLRFLLSRRTDPVIFDVGANRGDTVAEFLKHFPRAAITAFEPFEECHRGLQEKFRGASNVRLEKIAFGAARETRAMHLYSGNNMNSLLPMDTQPDNVLRDAFTETGTAEVTVETLDHYCLEHRVERLDLLKIDTQGYDLHVLRGAADLLRARRIGVVVVEINFIPMYQAQARFSEIHDYLASHGYRLADLYGQVYHQAHAAWADACYTATEG